MTVLSWQVVSYSNTVPQKRTLTDRIILTSPYDVTTILRLGLDNTSKFRLVNWPNRVYEWLEDTYVSRTDTLNSATNITNSTTTTTIPVTTVARFQVGDIIQIDSEYVYVDSISGSTLTIVRGFAGTTAATHESTASVSIRFTAREEGATSSDSPSTEVSSTTNCTQIFHKEVEVTRSAQRIPMYGMSNPWDYLINKNMDMLMEELDRVPFYGRRAVGTATAARASGGFLQYITTNATDLNSAALTRLSIDNLLEDCFDNAGRPNVIFCGAWAKRKLNDFYEGFVQTVRSERVGGILIDRLLHPILGYEIDVVVDRNSVNTDLWMIDDRYVGYLTFDEFTFEPLSKTGDAEVAQIVGEYGFVVAHEKAHARISEI